MSSEVAIRARGVSKCYAIFKRPEDRLKQMLSFGRRKYYREFWAVRNIDLDVYRGETIGIVGRNGSGKSTLLQIICGTLAASAGELTVNGRIAALLELGAGFSPEFTGRENVFMNASILGLAREEIEMRFDSIAAFADIGSFIEQPVSTYSSGMSARLAFAVAINVDPDILIVDEALSVGDEAFQRKCFARIAQIKERGGTILFVSHSAGTVVELCDRAVLIDNGERLFTGVPKRVVALYQKLIYAPLERIAEIREEVRALDGREIEVDTAITELATEAVSVLRAIEDTAHYDEGLLPTSTIEYASLGARITDVRIEDLSGRRVNVLVHGHRYKYRYRVDFTEECFKIGFGMCIKTVSGVELAGQGSHALEDGLEVIRAGQSIDVAFEFYNLLLPGTYFGNAGVASHVDGQALMLHRLLDAIMFRVKQFDLGHPISCLVNLKPDGGDAKLYIFKEDEMRQASLR